MSPRCWLPHGSKRLEHNQCHGLLLFQGLDLKGQCGYPSKLRSCRLCSATCDPGLRSMAFFLSIILGILGFVLCEWFERNASLV
jgi:hypothetical protein